MTFKKFERKAQHANQLYYLLITLMIKLIRHNLFATFKKLRNVKIYSFWNAGILKNC